VEDVVGFSCTVTLPATHDTGSAFLAVPLSPDETDISTGAGGGHNGGKKSGAAYISSGTWSLLGMETMTPLITPEGQKANFTNEGGYEYRYRFLKNIMGLWMVQSVRNELEKKHSFLELAQMAEEANSFPTQIDVNDSMFLAPKSMIIAVQEASRQSGQPIPNTTGEIVQCLYKSLAASYKDSITDMERITGKVFSQINLVGGGSKDEYLNRLTAQTVGIPVYTGPVEATVVGNLIVQMIGNSPLTDLASARQTIARSFDIKRF
jgi:rhamnulokinase